MITTKIATKTKFYKNKTFEDALFSILIFSIMLIIITNPSKFGNSTIRGIKLFFYSVFPGTEVPLYMFVYLLLFYSIDLQINFCSI